MKPSLERVLGPRVPQSELRRRFGRYLMPTALLIVAGVLLGASYTQTYWSMTLHAPQYPKGLHVHAHLNRLVGDVNEIDGLNHYIGMRPLNDAAQLERQTSAMLIVVVAGLLITAIFIHNRWAALAALPALVFPIGFLLDLQYWLATFGTNLDPHAALSSSIKPFVPPVLGVGTIGQFRTVATPGTGLWLATAASLTVVIALYFHRRAYKPLVDERQAAVRLSPPCSAVVAALVATFMALSPAARGHSGAEINDLNALIASAQPGSTLVVPAGVYRGPVLVNKSIEVVAQAGAIIDAGGVGDAMRVTAPDVTIRGFRVRNTGISLDQQNAGIAITAPRATIEDNTLDEVLLGLSLNGAAASVVRGNRIHGKNLDLSRRGDGIRVFSSDHALIEANEVAAVRDVVVWYSAGVRLTGNTVRDSRYGMHFMYANQGIVEDNHLVDNSVGVFLMYSRDVALRRNRLEHNRGPSGYGIGLKDMDDVRTEENTVVGNRVGLYVDNSPSRIDVVQRFRRNVFAFNDIGLAFLPSVQRNQFVENEFLENIEQVAILGSGELKNNDFTIAGRGNYWSDYAGFDADGDGLGDMPYRAMSLFESLIDREPKLRLFLYSPAQQAVELASRAFPIVRPQPKITDTSPLMRPAPAASSAAQAGVMWPLSALSAGLLTLAGLVIGTLRRRVAGQIDADDPADGSRTAQPEPRDERAQSTDRVVPWHTPDPAATADSILTLANLRKTFGRQVAVEGLDLALAPGQAVALWGTNGAGKTTIIKCILGLHAFRGGIRIRGRDVRREGKSARRLIGYVSQELSFYDDLSALETVRLFAALKGVPRARAKVVLAQVELLEHSGKRVAQLSGGMKQRLALAVALLADPPILLLDEPTSNLDAAARRSFFDLLRGLKTAGKTILFTTHRAEEVVGLADRVIVLERGRVVRDGAPDDFSAGCRLRISLPAEARHAALESLLRAGFDVTRNCTALVVRIPTARNATPIAHLAGVGIDVQTFEMESGDNP